MFFVFVFVFSLAIVYFTIRIARRFSLYDIQDGRRMHNEKTPRLGGIGIFLGFAAGIIVAALSGKVFPAGWFTWHWGVVACAATLVFATGFADDLKPIRARYKLIVQLLAGLAVCAFGLRFTTISFAPLNLNLNLGIFSWPATILWIAGLINIINMFDGLDGLAGTTSIIVFSSYAVFFFRRGYPETFFLCTIIIPAVLAFLAFNLPFPKAKIFMGDCGSNFLGFMLALFPLVQNRSGFPAVPVWYAATLMVFPICDFIAAICRRLREHRSIMSADFSHLHHKLVAIGLSQRQTLALLAALQAAVAALVLTAYFSGGVIALVILISIWTIAALFFAVVHINKNASAAAQEKRHI